MRSCAHQAFHLCRTLIAKYGVEGQETEAKYGVEGQEAERTEEEMKAAADDWRRAVALLECTAAVAVEAAPSPSPSPSLPSAALREQTFGKVLDEVQSQMP